jgi:hypothetical protein
MTSVALFSIIQLLPARGDIDLLRCWKVFMILEYTIELVHGLDMYMEVVYMN